MLTTRVGGVADAAAAAHLWTAAALARQASLTAAPGPAPDAAGAEARVLRMLGGPASLLVLAEDDGAPVAMTLIVQALTQDGAGPDPVPGLAHVTMVAVHPSHWGQGLGAAVMARAQTEARVLGYTHAQLWTQQTNTRAQRLYERLGWTPSGRTVTDDHGEQIRHYTCWLHR